MWQNIHFHIYLGTNHVSVNDMNTIAIAPIDVYDGFILLIDPDRHH